MLGHVDFLSEPRMEINTWEPIKEKAKLNCIKEN